MRGSIPTLTELNNYEVNRRGQKEGIRQSLYDFLLYPAAGTQQLTFFAQPQGQGSTTSSGYAAGSAKVLSDTNMETAGSLPAPKMFLAESLEMVIEPGSVSTANTFTLQNVYAFLAVAAAAFTAGAAANDVNQIRQTGFVRFYIGSKDYLQEAPIGRFPPKTRLEVDAAISSNSATTAEVGVISAKNGGRPYYIEPPILLQSTQNFAVYAQWPALVATASTFNARIGAILDGYLYRNSQ